MWFAPGPGDVRRGGTPGAAALILTGVVLHLVLYAASLPNLFTFDDRAIVVDSRVVRGTEPLVHAFRQAYFGIQYRPATVISLGLDARLLGVSPGAMRFENILWAGAGAGLFALLLVRLGASAPLAWTSLALTAAHPVRSEAILSIVGRSELLAFAFTAAALLAALASWRAPDRPSRIGFAALSAVAIAVALLSKENAFAAPFGLALVAALVRPRPPVRAAAPAAALWTFAFAAVFALRADVLRDVPWGSVPKVYAIENPIGLLPLPARAAAAAAVVPTAAARLVWPATLAADYGSRSLFGSAGLSPARSAAGAALLLAAVVAVLAARRARPFVAFGVAWTLVTWLPFANFAFPTKVAFAERLLFFAAPGVALALAAFLEPPPCPAALRAALVGGAVALGSLRIESRIPEWRDDRTLFEATVRDLPGNGRALMNLGVLALSRRDVTAAEDAVRRAVAADPAFCPGARALADHARTLGQAEAARRLDAALAPCGAR